MDHCIDSKMSFNQNIDHTEDETLSTDPAAGTMLESLNNYQSHETVKNFQVLLSRVLSGGHPIDMKLNRGQTLLHHAVSLDLVKEVLKILNCGAILMKNKYGKTPLDIAVERGNQIILQILNRSAEYQNYIKGKFSDSSLPSVHLGANRKSDAMSDTIFGQHKFGWTQFELDEKNDQVVQRNSHTRSIVYDDYLDWTGSQRAKHQDVRTKTTLFYCCNINIFFLF